MILLQQCDRCICCADGCCIGVAVCMCICYCVAANDGTLLSAAAAQEHPVLTFKSGPVNSVRGAAFLAGGCVLPSQCLPDASCWCATCWCAVASSLSSTEVQQHPLPSCSACCCSCCPSAMSNAQLSSRAQPAGGAHKWCLTLLLSHSYCRLCYRHRCAYLAAAADPAPLQVWVMPWFVT